MSNIKAHINSLIEEIKASEKITKVKLAILSRDILSYVLDYADIDSVNRLTGVLTPQNRTTAILFFKHFLPHEQEHHADGSFSRFGKLMKGDKKVARKAKLIGEFLADPDNTIWTWADKNVQVEVKQKDFAGMITRTVSKALEGDEKTDTPALDRTDILAAVFAAGVSIEDMMTAIDEQEAREQAALEEAERVAEEQMYGEAA